jgi:RNA polymerase sigma-70 factor (ECF subfamily)
MPIPPDHPAAFRDLYERHRADVWRYFRRRTSEQTAEDLTTEVFVVAWRRRAEPPESAREWLFGVARYVLANHRRREGRAAALTERAQREAPQAGEDHAELADVRADIRAALRQLRPADREVLLLTAWEGLTSVEVAKVLGCRPATARARLLRARRRMRAVLDPGDPAARPAFTQEASL